MKPGTPTSSLTCDGHYPHGHRPGNLHTPTPSGKRSDLALVQVEVRRRSVVAMDQNDGDLAIDIRGLVKTFGSTLALDGLDLQVRRGEVHAFLGPNGSGKTTTLRVLLGLLRADSGSVRLLDGDPWRDAAALHRRLAYVPGDVTLWPNLTGGEVIDLLGRMRGGLDERRRATLLERFELDPTKKSRSYSKGNRQKVALVAALSSDVELLLLDEPTAGLDPLMEAMFRRCIDEERGQGRTVLLSSHILAEAEVLCDRVSIVRHGRIAESGTLAELRHLTRTSVTAELDGDPADLTAQPGVHALDVSRTPSGTTQVRCQVDSDQLGGTIQVLSAAGIRSLTSRPPTLEELFLQHYSDSNHRSPS
jgi:ABC-2 type transport system ATP-binding protein